AGRGRRSTGPSAHDDARRPVPLRTYGGSGALPADERQLRVAGAARAAGEGQAEEEGVAGGAGAGRHGCFRGTDQRGSRNAERGTGRSCFCSAFRLPPSAFFRAVTSMPPEISAFVAFLAKERNDSP